MGSGDDISIYDLASLVARVVGFTGAVEKDASKPDGTPRKLMSADRLRRLGWTPRIDLETGIREVYQQYSL